MRVLITDQFTGPSPYELQRHPVPFEALVAESTAQAFRPGRVADVPDDYEPEMATSVFRADAHGNAALWRCRWDSSG